jgi:glycosyltransferase involved in cell wall biosynthesis
MQKCQQLGIETRTVVCHEGNFFPVEPHDFQRFAQLSSRRQNTLAAMPATYRLAAKAVYRCVPVTPIQKWFLPEPGHLGIFKGWLSLQQKRIFASISQNQHSLEFRPGDLLVLPDAYWAGSVRTSIWNAAARARQGSAKVATLIYDLIPLSHPEFVGEKRRAIFEQYLNSALAGSDTLLAISENVRDELRKYIEAQHTPGPNRVSSADMPITASFPLGAEIQHPNLHDPSSVRPEVKRIFAQATAPYLTVAAFDPRKNHHFLLDAFDQIWKAGNFQPLCLVGRMGPKCNKIQERIQQHPQRGKLLHVFHDLSDSELHYAYSKCRAVIFPSVVEGFGLPIVESRWFGKKTFASDIPVHREVGCGDCSYFTIDDPRNLVTQLLEWEASGESRATAAVHQPTSWQASSEAFLQQCFRLFENTQQIDSMATVHDSAKIRAA